MGKKKAVKKTVTKKTAAKKKASGKSDPKPSPATSAQPSIILKTFAEISQEFGVTYDTVKNWKRCGMPGSTGNYDRDAIDKWVTINGKGKQSTKKLSDDELTDEAARAVAIQEIEKANKLGAEASLLARKDRIEQGGLCRRHDVERFVTQFLSECRQLHEKMVPKFAAGYGHELAPVLRDDLGKCCETILNQLHDFMERLEDLEIEG